MTVRKSLQETLDFYYRFRLSFLSKFYFRRKRKFIEKKRILFWPQSPHRRTIIYQICREIGLKVIQDPAQNNDLAVYWEDNSFSPDQDSGVLAPETLNRKCTDITKTRDS